MVHRGIERRTCERFEVPGATLCYRREGLLPFSKEYTEECFPIVDISRGGLRFLSETMLKVDAMLSLKVTLPGDETPLLIKGRVSWASVNPGVSYKYQIGIQFEPYGDKKSENDPESLRRITALEQKFLPAKSGQ